MSPENIRLSIIGGMLGLVALVYAMPVKKKDKDRQGSSSNGNSLESAAKSVKDSINSLASSSPIKFGKSKSSTLSFGGSQRNRRVSKQRTKSRR
jgi:hypothetical protein